MTEKYLLFYKSLSKIHFMIKHLLS